MQVKYIDDSSQATSINLKKSLMVDPENRTRPLTFHERHQNILKPEKNILQSELDRFDQWTLKNKFVVISKKCFVMQFSRSRNYDFPIEFKISGSGHPEKKRVVRILGKIFIPP